jgi:hypothetical protein
MGKINKEMLKHFQIVLKDGGRISKSDVAKAFGYDDNELFIAWQNWEKFKTFKIEGDFIIVDTPSATQIGSMVGNATARVGGEDKVINNDTNLDTASTGASQIAGELHFENLGRPGQAKNYTGLEREYMAKDKKKARIVPKK